MNKKIVFFPGWMRSVAYYEKYDGIDIWKEDFDTDIKIEADYVVGHSLGALIALANWQTNNNAKLILVNPLLLKKKFSIWMYRWLRFAFDEGPQANKTVGLGRLWYGLKKFHQLSKVNVADILDKIPEDKLIVIRGCKDRFFCDDETSQFAKVNNIKIIEVPEASHQWHKKFDDIIEKIVNS